MRGKSFRAGHYAICCEQELENSRRDSASVRDRIIARGFAQANGSVLRQFEIQRVNLESNVATTVSHSASDFATGANKWNEHHIAGIRVRQYYPVAQLLRLNRRVFAAFN